MGSPRERVYKIILVPGSDDDPRSPLSAALGGDGDARSRAVWGEWLASMAKDPEVALAAAMTYRELSDAGRERWLHTLVNDAALASVPRVAVFGPLLGVEDDPERRTFLLQQIQEDPQADPSGVHRALLGVTPVGHAIVVIVMPLYLDFVQLLACTLDRDRFVEVRHDPIALRSRAPREFERLEGARLESVSLKAALDQIAAAILRHRRENWPVPDAVRCLVDLLGRVGP